MVQGHWLYNRLCNDIQWLLGVILVATLNIIGDISDSQYLANMAMVTLATVTITIIIQIDV